jgi:prepilin-type N-terminal cleavage/methylation domain-containing protein
MEKTRRTQINRRGFTLLEVIVSLAILAVALLGFNQGQTSSVRLSVRSEKLAQATGLAQQKMTELELKIVKSGLVSIPEEEKGEFQDPAFKEYTWVRKSEKVSLSCFMPKQKKQAAGQEGYYALAEKSFESAIRKLKVTIEWQEGNKKRSTTLSQLYVRFEDIISP